MTTGHPATKGHDLKQGVQGKASSNGNESDFQQQMHSLFFIKNELLISLS